MSPKPIYIHISHTTKFSKQPKLTSINSLSLLAAGEAGRGRGRLVGRAGPALAARELLVGRRCLPHVELAGRRWEGDRPALVAEGPAVAPGRRSLRRRRPSSLPERRLRFFRTRSVLVGCGGTDTKKKKQKGISVISRLNQWKPNRTALHI